MWTSGKRLLFEEIFWPLATTIGAEKGWSVTIRKIRSRHVILVLPVTVTPVQGSADRAYAPNRPDDIEPVLFGVDHLPKRL